MARAKKFSRIPLPAEFAGVPREAVAAYCALASYANNSNGLCWPKMETLASTLGCSVRTVQRHLSALRDAGMIRFLERRRVRGRFSSYTYQLVHFLTFTTGHKRPPAKRSPNIERTKPSFNEGNHDENRRARRQREAARRLEGFEWLFKSL